MGWVAQEDERTDEGAGPNA